jgi:transcriptional regulator GlxA family with amidase domain
MSHDVAVLAFPGISPFHLSVPSLVFENAALTTSEPHYRVTVWAEQPGPLATQGGYDVMVRPGLEACASADTVIVPSWDRDLTPSPALISALRAAHDRGARIVGLCLGAFPVAAAGLLEGRRAATHWNAAGALKERYPSVVVAADVLWVDHGDVVTSAGVAAALDCCLHVVRQDLGAVAAVAVARHLVLAPHRDGGQAQFIPVPVTPGPAADPIGIARLWALERLEEPLDLETWARAAAMSRRTFTRQFRAHTGVSPRQWLLDQRLLRAKLLLESTTDTIERIATTVGFATAASLRHHFSTRFGTTPARHRSAFSCLS